MLLTTFVAWHMLSILPPAQHSVWEAADVVYSVITLPSITWLSYTFAASMSWCQQLDSEVPRSRKGQQEGSSSVTLLAFDPPVGRLLLALPNSQVLMSLSGKLAA